MLECMILLAAGLLAVVVALFFVHDNLNNAFYRLSSRLSSRIDTLEKHANVLVERDSPTVIFSMWGDYMGQNKNMPVDEVVSMILDALHLRLETTQAASAKLVKAKKTK